jgi:predicted nucleic acid-binding protein
VSSDRPVLYVAEPSASYLVRTPLVVDCSVLVAVLFEEETYEHAVELISGKNLFAPSLLAHEIVNVALKKRRLGFAVDDIVQAFYDYANYEIELRQTESLAQYELAQRYNLSAYDAAYLWLAAELKAPLATFDKKLADAAKSHLAGLA